MLKKLLALLLVVGGAFTLAACEQTPEGPTDLEKLAEALEELDVQQEVSSDITLPNTGLHDVEITWESSDTDVIANDGTVTVPLFTEGDQEVTITAYLTIGDQTLTKEFDVTVLASDTKTDAEKVAEAKAALGALSFDQVVSDITLPTTSLEADVTWTSSDPDVLTAAGEVTRPAAGEGNADVTLTATITVGDASDTLELEVTVAEEIPSTVFSSVATLHTDAGFGDIVEFQGIVSAIFDGGYFLTDGTNAIGIFNAYVSGGIEPDIGDEVYVKGEYGYYHTNYQIADPTEEDIVSTGNTVTLTPEVKTVAEILNLDSAVKINHGKLFTVTATIELIDGDVFLVDGDDKFMVYYYSYDASISALEAKEGLEVTVTITYYTDHDDNGLMVVFDGGADDIEVGALSDAEALAADITWVATQLPEMSTSDLTLPATGDNGSTFSNWASSDTAVYADDGTFVASGTETVTITFTADVTKGSETGTVSVEVVVPVSTTVAEALLIENGEYVQVTGVVFAESYYGFFIDDNGSYIFIFDFGYSSSDMADEIENGDEVTVIGELDSYGGLKEIYPEDYTINSNDNATPTAVDSTIEEVVMETLPKGTIVTVKGTVVYEADDDGDMQVYIEGVTGARAMIYFSDKDVIASGDNSTYTGQIVTLDLVLYQDGRYQFFGTDSDIQVADPQSFSDAEKAQAALDTINLGDIDNVLADLTLPTTIATETVTWASDDETVIATDGTVTRVAGSDTVVTLTASVTVGAETLTRDFVTTVIDLNDSDPMTVADALLELDGTTVLVEGVVSGFYYDDPFIQDADGTAIYIDAGLADDVAVGDHIVVSGTLSTWKSYGNNQRDLSGVTLVEVVSSGNTVFVDDTVTAVELAGDHAMYSSQRLTMDLTIADLDDGDGYVFFEGTPESSAGAGDEVYIKFKTEDFAPYLADVYEVGDVLTLTFNVFDMNFDNVRITAVEMPELTDTQKLDVVEGFLTEDGTTVTVEEDVELPTDEFLADYDVTVSWVSTDDTVFNATTGVVTRPAEGAGDATVTVTATLTLASGTTRDVVFTVTVPESVPAMVYDSTETFTNFDLTGSSYGAGSFTGDNSIVWAYTESRGDFELTGKAIMLDKDGDGASLTATITGGIGSLSIDYFDAYSGAAQVVIIINEGLASEVTFTSDAVDYDGSGDVATFTVADINIEGEFTISIYSGDSQMVLDNLQWTSYGDDTSPMNVADALAASTDDTLTFEATVKFVLSDGTFLVEDPDGTAIYVDDYSSSLGTWPTVVVGDKVSITGDRGSYQVPLIDTISDITVVSSGNALATAAATPTDLADLRTNATDADFGLTYTFTDVEIFSISSDYIYFYSSDGTTSGVNKMGIYVDASVDLSSLQEGDVVTFTGIFFDTNGWYDNDGTIWRFAVTDVADVQTLGNVADAVAASTDDKLFVGGTVKYVLSDGTFLVEDPDGTAIYVDDYSSSLGTWPTVAVGDNVRILGDRGLYQVPLIDTINYLVVESSGNALATAVATPTDLADLRTNATDADFGLTYTFTDVEIFSISSDYIYFYSSDGTTSGVNKMGIYVDASVDLSSLQEGDVVTFTGIFFDTNGWYDNDGTIWRFAVTDAADLTVTTPAS